MKKLIFFFLLTHSIVFSQISPANPSVKVGNSITITASSTISCPSSGFVGTFSGCGTTSVIYTAPSSVIPKKVVQGWQAGPNDAIWYSPVNTLPVDPNSTTKINQLLVAGAGNLAFQPSWGIGYVPLGTTHFTPVSVYSGSFVFPSFPDPQFSGWYTSGEYGSFVGVSDYFVVNPFNVIPDTHGIQVDTSTGSVYETYHRNLNGTTRTCNGCTPGTFTSNLNGAQTYSTTNYLMPSNITGGGGNVDAASLELMPITLNNDEMETGQINHMLRFTACGGCINYSANVWPAMGNLGNGSGCTLTTCLPFGGIIHIKNSQLASLKSTYCGSNIKCQNLLTAINTYGMIMADISSGVGGIQVSPQVTLDPTNVVAMSLASIPLTATNFEVVTQTSEQVNTTSYATCPNGLNCGYGSQSYVSQPNQAWVSVGGAIYPIAIQAIGLGLANNWPSYLPIVAGSYSVQFPTLVSGTANQNVLWSFGSGVGSITSAGLYTPPASVSGPTITILSCKSQADTNVTMTVILNVIPASSPSLIQDDTQSSSNTLDANSNTWLADLGVENNYYPVASSVFTTSQTPYATQFNTSMFYNGFVRKYYLVPNGTYNVDILLGEGENSASAGASWPGNRDLYALTPLNIEINGQIQKHWYDWSLGTYYLYGFGNIVTVPAKVSNNLLEIGIYDVIPDVNTPTNGFSCTSCINPNFAPFSGNKLVELNAVRVSSSAASPYLGIDVSNVLQTISSGGKTEVWPIDGGVTLPIGPSAVTWSLVAPVPSGATITPNTYDNGAIISLPSGTYRKSDVVLVKATYGAYSATKAISIAGSSNPLMQLH